MKRDIGSPAMEAPKSEIQTLTFNVLSKIIVVPDVS